MKTTKSKTKVNSENGSFSTIQNFFKTAQKESIERPSSSNVKSIYMHALVDKLQSFDDEDTPSNERKLAQRNGETASSAPTAQPLADRAEKDKCEVCGRDDKIDGCGECDKWRNKYEEVKKSHIKLSLRYTDLMLKYEDVVEVAKGTVRANVNTEKATDGPQTSSISNGIASQTLSTSDGAAQSLCQTDDIFTENEIKCLKCISLDKTKDSTFILNCVQYAYKNDAASLTMKTLKGTRSQYEVNDSGDLVEVKAGKDPLTPEKVQRMQQLFIDRVTKSKCMAGEFGERVKETYFNKLVATAIKNISNKAAPKKKPSNQNEVLNL